MTYFPDLAPCTYFDRKLADKLVAVGWLDFAIRIRMAKSMQNFSINSSSCSSNHGRLATFWATTNVRFVRSRTH